MPSIACISGIISTLICFWRWRHARGTTFAAPVAWAIFSLTALTVAAAISLDASEGDRPMVLHLNYLAGLTMLAPFVALLGAKRPQDRAWQLIVASLLGLLAIQDLRIWSFDQTRPPLPHAAWCWLVAGLSGMQLLNYLPTRFAPAACLAYWAQLCSLGPCFRVLPADLRPPWLSLPLFLASVVLAALLNWCRPQNRHSAWVDFRNLYGVLWTLRVAERVNAIAAEKHLDVRLTWHGWQAATGGDIKANDCHQALRAILLRFVSPQWLAQREVG